jgi:hypothetical protein
MKKIFFAALISCLSSANFSWAQSAAAPRPQPRFSLPQYGQLLRQRDSVNVGGFFTADLGAHPQIEIFSWRKGASFDSKPTAEPAFFLKLELADVVEKTYRVVEATRISRSMPGDLLFVVGGILELENIFKILTAEGATRIGAKSEIVYRSPTGGEREITFAVLPDEPCDGPVRDRPHGF